MRSASRSTLLVAATLALGGCSTTMQEAARLQLNDARIRASEVPTKVTVPGHAVQVTGVSLVRGVNHQTAFVVRVRNPGPRAVSDLPISVGLSARGRRTYLNLRSPAELSYFNSHLPVIAAGGSLTWVVLAGTPVHLAAHARPFAVVGGSPEPPAQTAGSPPDIRASAGTARAGRLAVVLRSLSGVPQYQLQVYAFARAAGRYVAAGALTVPHLGTGSRRRIELPLVGRAGGGDVQVEALPTIFR